MNGLYSRSQGGARERVLACELGSRLLALPPISGVISLTAISSSAGDRLVSRSGISCQHFLEFFEFNQKLFTAASNIY